MFNCPNIDLPEATITKEHTKEHSTEDTAENCSRLEGTSLTSLELEYDLSRQRCEVSPLSHCSVFGYVTVFDGLGHYFNKLRTLMVTEHEAGIYRSYKAYFEEYVGLSAIHLKLPNLPHNASLYCHQKQLASDNGFSNDQDLWERQYECNLVPPLDDWFNLRSELFDPKQDHQCVRVQVHRTTSRLSLAGAADLPKPTDFLRERYWARSHKNGERPGISCRGASRPKRSSSDWDVATHLRLGDLIAPAIGSGDASRDRREDNWGERAAETAKGMRSVLRTLSKLKATLENISDDLRFVSLVVSDSPFEVVSEFLKKEAGIQLEVVRIDHDEYASYTIVAARFEGSDEAMQLEFMSSDANPLVSMHCLAAADALVLPFHKGDRMGPSSFALMAATLGRGSVIQTAEELLERVSRINGDSPVAWADSFVQHVLSPHATFAAEREEGAYPQERLPTPEDPL
jgi:hypothetical protein